MLPNYIFETSWEVCNQVGGIYAVLSTRAASMQQHFPDHVIFVGPDLGKQSDIYFHEDPSVLSSFPAFDHPIRIGRWLVPGNPIAVLIRYDHLWERKNDIYGWAWQHFGVQSHAAHGDYDDSCLFGYAAGEVIAHYASFINHSEPAAQIVAHANEWQTAFALFYLRAFAPSVRTLFTTHATGIGRSIAGNGKPLYDYFTGYHGDQMAQELGLISKHSAEKQAAHVADCFTTVSELTARECHQLLERPVDIVTPNGFCPDFVPKAAAFTARRTAARKALAKVAGCTTDAFFICTAGRLEWRNKGIDVFIDSMKQLATETTGNRRIVAFVLIPYLEHENIQFGNLQVIFVPHYLNGHDPIFARTYYDLLIGMDATVFPSYYEPWGYTPLESIAFGVPTITTSLSGFGLWAKNLLPSPIPLLANGVAVVERNDSNYHTVVTEIAHLITEYLSASKQEIAAARRAAKTIAEQAEWKHFFPFYLRAYDIALSLPLAR